MSRAVTVADLSRSVESLRGVGPALQERLANIGIRVVRDLLFHFPLRYEDRRVPTLLASLVHAEEKKCTVIATVLSVRSRRVPGRGVLVDARVEDESGRGEVLWFRQPYVAQSLKAGDRVYFYGTWKEGTRRGSLAQATNPEFERIVEGRSPKAFGGLVPHYPRSQELGRGRLRSLVADAVRIYGSVVPEILLAEERERERLPTMAEALGFVHRPRDWEEVERGRRRLAVEEVYPLQTALVLLRAASTGSRRRPLSVAPETRAQIESLFPFELTSGQKKCVEEILEDLEKSWPMNRLLQGDVGSGKTAVAACAIFAVVREGGQVALMVPSELLAHQHWELLRSWLPRSSASGGEERVGLLTGNVRGGKRRELASGVASGEIAVVVGTQALLSADLAYRDLRLVVIDEQHRFGVGQRLRLRPDGETVDTLVLSATPIPRSLALTLFGDLDHSKIEGRPPGRSPVKTRSVTRDQIVPMLQFIRERVSEGERAFFICPLVSDGEGSELQAAESLRDRLARGAFRDRTVGVVHGRQSDEEKQRVFEEFRRGGIEVLVATVVVEVGVDVPEATVMVILNAERFGLAQLHQLRGRVGRGEKPGYCFLLSSEGEEDEARLQVLVTSQDGFRIAEEDLRIRGTGSFSGMRQHGWCEFRVLDPIKEGKLIREVRGWAQTRIENDPRLARRANHDLRVQVLDLARRGGLDLVRIG